MKRILSAISALIWLALTVICLPALVQPRNFAVIWFLPYVLLFACNALVFFKKQISVKILGFCVYFGLVVAISPMLFFGFDMILSLPLVTYVPILPTLLSFVILVCEKRNRNNN